MVSVFAQAHLNFFRRVQELKLRVNVTTSPTLFPEGAAALTGTSKIRRTLVSVVVPSAADTTGLARLSAEEPPARAPCNT